jgi:hypothetical protein
MTSSRNHQGNKKKLKRKKRIKNKKRRIKNKRRTRNLINIKKKKTGTNKNKGLISKKEKDTLPANLQEGDRIGIHNFNYLIISKTNIFIYLSKTSFKTFSFLFVCPNLFFFYLLILLLFDKIISFFYQLICRKNLIIFLIVLEIFKR